MLVPAQPAADGVTFDQLYARLVIACRATGTVGSLTVALATLAVIDFSPGREPDTVGNATEGLRLCGETGQPAMAGYFLVLLALFAARQGRADDSRRLADEAVREPAHDRLPPAQGLAKLGTTSRAELGQLHLDDSR